MRISRGIDDDVVAGGLLAQRRVIGGQELVSQGDGVDVVGRPEMLRCGLRRAADRADGRRGLRSLAVPFGFEPIVDPLRAVCPPGTVGSLGIVGLLLGLRGGGFRPFGLRRGALEGFARLLQYAMDLVDAVPVDVAEVAVCGGEPCGEGGVVGEFVDADHQLGVHAGAPDELDQVGARRAVGDVAGDIAPHEAAQHAEKRGDEGPGKGLIALEHREDENEGEQRPAPSRRLRALAGPGHREYRRHDGDVRDELEIGLLDEGVGKLAGDGREREVAAEQPQEAVGEGGGAGHSQGARCERAPSAVPGHVDDQRGRQEKADEAFQGVDGHEQDRRDDAARGCADVAYDGQGRGGTVDCDDHYADDRQQCDDCRHQISRTSQPPRFFVNEQHRPPRSRIRQIIVHM